MYKHVIFDLYGTLIDIHTDEHDIQLWVNMAQLLSSYGVTYQPQELEQTFFCLCDQQLQANSVHTNNAEIDVVKVWQTILKASKHKVNKSDATLLARTMRSMSIQHMQLYSGVLPLLTKLKKAKVHMHLLSNGQRPYVATELRLMGIARFFNEKIISSDHGIAKPNATLLDIITNKHNIALQDIVMIGNDLTSDITFANNAGIDSIYLDNGTVSSGKGQGIVSTYGITDGNYNEIYNIIMQ